MKYLSLLVVLPMWLMGTNSLLWAQTTAATPVIYNPKVAVVYTRIHHLTETIKTDLKNGTIGQEEANDLMKDLKSIRSQITADFDANGKAELTDNQLSALNQMLDSNLKLINSEKHAPSHSGNNLNSSPGGSSRSSSSGAPR